MNHVYSLSYVFIKKIKCGYSLMVGRVLAKDELGVRFSLPAQSNEVRMDG